MSNDDASRIFLLVMVVVIPVAIVIGGELLRAACVLYNKLASGKESSNSVPIPPLSVAMGIALLITLANPLTFSRLFDRMDGPDSNVRVAIAIVQLLYLPIYLLVIPGIIATMLPTTFVRGLLVAVCYLLVLFVVFGVIAGGLFLAFPLQR